MFLSEKIFVIYKKFLRLIGRYTERYLSIYRCGSAGFSWINLDIFISLMNEEFLKEFFSQWWIFFVVIRIIKMMPLQCPHVIIVMPSTKILLFKKIYMIFCIKFLFIQKSQQVYCCWVLEVYWNFAD